MSVLSIGWAVILRFCSVGLFIVAAIIYWGAWTPTTAAGLLSAGLACLAGSFLFVPERTTQRHEPKVRTTTYDEPMAHERTYVGR